MAETSNDSFERMLALAQVEEERAFRDEIERDPGRKRILAEGDSWFAYPREYFLFGAPSNVVHHLRRRDEFAVKSTSSNGDEAVAMLSGSSKLDLLERLERNYFDLLLFSGGGNDIVGVFDMDFFLRPKQFGMTALDCIEQKRFSRRLEQVANAYRDLLDLISTYSANPDVKVVTHTYDLVIPSARGATFLGGIYRYENGTSWMFPFLHKRGITETGEQKEIAKHFLERFGNMLLELQNEYRGRLYVAQTQGTLMEDEWLNEIHPTPDGFKKIENKIYARIQDAISEMPVAPFASFVPSAFTGNALRTNEMTVSDDTSILLNLYNYREAAVQEALRESQAQLPQGVLTPFGDVVQPNMMFLYYEYEGDPRDGKFVNPLDVKPNLLKNGKYQLDFEMVTLHVDNLIEELKINNEKPLEHRLFTRAPFERAGHRDWLEWIVTSAINVFLAGDRVGRDKKLQTFAEGSKPTATLKEQEKIVVESGSVALGQGLWGHREKHWFNKFWGLFSQTLSAPLIAAVGIPALVPTAVNFVNKVLLDYEEKSKIRPLWQTKKLNFKIAPDAPGDFGLKPGLWTIVATDYVQKNPNLLNHKVDFAMQSFEILDAQDRPISAPYLVNRVHLEPIDE